MAGGERAGRTDTLCATRVVSPRHIRQGWNYDSEFLCPRAADRLLFEEGAEIVGESEERGGGGSLRRT